MYTSGGRLLSMLGRYQGKSALPVMDVANPGSEDLDVCSAAILSVA